MFFVGMGPTEYSRWKSDPHVDPVQYEYTEEGMKKLAVYRF